MSCRTLIDGPAINAPAETPSERRRKVRQESLAVGGCALVLALLSLRYCSGHGLLLLYGDAVAHLHIARRVFDSLNPGFRQLGSVWLPLPHVLLTPFVQRMTWWQSAVPAALPSMACYIAGCIGIYRLARLWLSPAKAALAACFYALNPGLLYMQTTAMTEPLFLAEMIWAALLIAEHGRALEVPEFKLVGADFAAAPRTAPDTAADADACERRAGRMLLAAGLVLVAAVYTRYDGWIYGAFAWLVVAAGFLRSRASPPSNPRSNPIRWRSRLGGTFVLFTIMLAAAPATWVAYNAKQFGDPLDFMRGPYSAKAIEARTSTPGAAHYPGWHSMRVAELYFLKAAEGGAVPIGGGNFLLLLTLSGTVYAAARWQGTAMRAALLLWIPAPFYAYSVAYGSVPIFIPLWWPHSWYNTRYGMEMLPAFALFSAMSVAAVASAIGFVKPRWGRAVLAAAFALTILNAVVVMRATPLVLAEAYANSMTRIPFERALAGQLERFPQRPILMYTSAHVGALQQAGIPLRTTINEGDYFLWRTALADPAAAAPLVVIVDGDPVAGALAAHPANRLQLAATICSPGQPCARIYMTTGAAATSTGMASAPARKPGISN